MFAKILALAGVIWNHNYLRSRIDQNFASLRRDPECQSFITIVKSHWKEYRRAYRQTNLILAPPQG